MSMYIVKVHMKYGKKFSRNFRLRADTQLEALKRIKKKYPNSTILDVWKEKPQ